jgi:hypothetical protein
MSVSTDSGAQSATPRLSLIFHAKAISKSSHHVTQVLRPPSCDAARQPRQAKEPFRHPRGLVCLANPTAIATAWRTARRSLCDSQLPRHDIGFFLKIKRLSPHSQGDRKSGQRGCGRDSVSHRRRIARQIPRLLHRQRPLARCAHSTARTAYRATGSERANASFARRPGDRSKKIVRNCGAFIHQAELGAPSVALCCVGCHGSSRDCVCCSVIRSEAIQICADRSCTGQLDTSCCQPTAYSGCIPTERNIKRRQQRRCRGVKKK